MFWCSPACILGHGDSQSNEPQPKLVNHHPRILQPLFCIKHHITSRRCWHLPSSKRSPVAQSRTSRSESRPALGNQKGFTVYFCNPRSVHCNQWIVPPVERRTVHVGQRAHPGKRFAVVALNYYLFCALNTCSLSGAKVLEVPIPHPFEMRVVFETIACGTGHCAAVGAGAIACALCEHDDA